MSSNQKSIYITFIFIQSVLYGIGNPLAKITFSEMPVYWNMTFRFVTAFLIFMLFFGKRIVKEIGQTKWQNYLPAGLWMAASYVFGNLALKWAAVTTAGFLMALPVVFAPILSYFVLKSKYNRRHIIIQVMAVIGLYLLCSGGGVFQLGKGETLALITAVCAAGALVYGEKSLAGLSIVTVSAVQTGITALVSFFLAVTGERLQVGQVSGTTWAILLYLAILCTCVTYLLQNKAVKNISAQTVSLLQTTQPIMTAIFSFVLLGEILTVRAYIGAAVILVCVLMESVFAGKK